MMMVIYSADFNSAGTSGDDIFKEENGQNIMKESYYQELYMYITGMLKLMYCTKKGEHP